MNQYRWWIVLTVSTRNSLFQIEGEPEISDVIPPTKSLGANDKDEQQDTKGEERKWLGLCFISFQL